MTIFKYTIPKLVLEEQYIVQLKGKVIGFNLARRV